MTRKLIQTKRTTLSYGINDSATTMRLVNLLKLDGTAMSASDIGDVLYGTFDPGTSREEIFSIASGNVTVNSDGTVDITSVVRGLQEVDPYSTGGFATDHPAGAVVVFGNNPQVYAQFGKLADANTWALLQTFTILPKSNGGNATEDTQLVTYAQALALATGTANINRVVVAGNAGETVTAGQLLYLDVADGEWKKCDADTAGSVNNIILGIAQGAGTDGVAITSGVLLFGLDSNQTGLTTNTAYYASNTAGGISTTAGTTEVSVGISRSTTSLLFYPRYNQQLTEDQQDALAGDNGTPSDTNKFMTQSGFQLNAEKYLASAAGSDTYAIALSPALGAYANGEHYFFKADVANTGPATLNINGLGAISLVTALSTALVTGDIVANQIVEVIYNSTGPVFQIVNPASAVLSLTNLSKIYTDVVTAGTAVVNATTTVYTQTIDANTFIAESRMTLYLSYKIDSSSGSTPATTLNIIFGGTTICTKTTGTTTSGDYILKLEVLFGATAGTADITSFLIKNTSGTTTTTSEMTRASATADLTSNQTFTIQAICVANATLTYYASSMERH